ncbi:MAG: hypothetical protein AB1393_00585 [Candidatus Edwardsbacteria bacterium]
MLFFVLLQPVLTFIQKRKEKPIVALLVDTSTSMKIKDRNEKETRFDKTKKILKDRRLFDALKKQGEVKVFQFSQKICPSSMEKILNDSLSFGEGTNLANAFEGLRKACRNGKLGVVVLLSDGSNNLGRDPIKEGFSLQAPIYTIGLGDTNFKRDTEIKRVFTNEIVYAGDRLPVEVAISNKGFAGRRIKISLKEGKEILAELPMFLSEGDQRVVLEFVPKIPGLHRYQVSIPLEKEETIEQNNSKEFAVNVLKSKIKVLFVIGNPDWDSSFLQRLMAKDNNVLLTLLFLRQKKLNDLSDYDLLILSGDLYLRQEEQQKILDFVKVKGGGILILQSALASLNKSTLGEMLPFVSVEGEVEKSFNPEITPQGRLHPIMQVSEDWTENESLFKELPPLLNFSRIRGVKPFAEVLAVNPSFKTAQGKMAVIAIGKFGRGKIVALGASSFWRWDFLMSVRLQPLGQGAGKSNECYKKIFSNTVRWLVLREDLKGVQVKTDKKIYQDDEEIEFQAQVYNENFRGIEGALVKVRLEKTREEFFLNSIGGGKYVGEIKALPAGDYSFSAEVSYAGLPTVFVAGKNLQKVSGDFSVVASQRLEYEDTRMNQELLQELSKISGGNFYTLDNAFQLLKDLKLPAQWTTTLRQLELWRQPFLFLACIILLGLEWWWRKKLGLA